MAQSVDLAFDPPVLQYERDAPMSVAERLNPDRNKLRHWVEGQDERTVYSFVGIPARELNLTRPSSTGSRRALPVFASPVGIGVPRKFLPIRQISLRAKSTRLATCRILERSPKERAEEWTKKPQTALKANDLSDGVIALSLV